MNSTTITNVLYNYFGLKKNKLQWTGTLEDLKAFVLTEIDENIAESTSWRSPSGGTWQFDSKPLSVTWHSKSGNIYFKGDNGEDLTERVHSLNLKQGEHELVAKTDNPTEIELVKQIENVSARVDIDDLSACNAVKLPNITASVTGEVLMSTTNGAIAEKHSSQHHQNDEAISQCQSRNAKVESTKSKTTLNLHKESQNKHAVSKSQNILGNTNLNCNCESEIGTLKSKMERFADNVANKLDDLTSEIHNMKENKLYSIVALENVIDDLKKEKRDLYKTNVDLREQNISMKNTIADLSLTNENLKNEKASLLTALRLIQLDPNQLTANANAVERGKPWQVVNERKTLDETKKPPSNPDTLPYNLNVMTSEYPDKGGVSMRNRYEVLSDSDENSDNESTNKLNPSKQGHKESRKSYASAATLKSSNDHNSTQKHTTDISSSSSRPENKNKNEDDNNNPVTIIVGDSMIKGLRPDKISKSVKHKTQIKSFPGSTVEDLNDYIKPSLKEET